MFPERLQPLKPSVRITVESSGDSERLRTINYRNRNPCSVATASHSPGTRSQYASPAILRPKSTSVRMQMLGTLLGPELVSEGRSAIFSGPPGRGMTHLAIAEAYRANPPP